MLSYQLKGDILTVKETSCSFTDTKIRYTSYNIWTWKTSGLWETADRPCIYEMTDGAIEWVKKYYLPKVGK